MPFKFALLIRCELCPFSNPRLPAFLQHITDNHVYDELMSYFNPESEYALCETCHQYVHHLDWVAHLGYSESPCNWSLTVYFRWVTEQQHGGILPSNYVDWTYEQCLQRLRTLRNDAAAGVGSRPKPDIFASRYIQPESEDFMEDPVSSEISFGLNLIDSYVEVEFKNRLPMKSFKSASKFAIIDEKFTCALCPLFRSSWEAPEGGCNIVDSFSIHLANNHFKKELEKMFSRSGVSSAGGGGDYECCRESYNFQNLVGHLKEAHSTIINMYWAVMPMAMPVLNDDNPINKEAMRTRYVSHMMRWLPNYSQDVKKVDRQGSHPCKICHQRIAGALRELTRHYINAHFLGKLEEKYRQELAAPPYRCPERSCVFAGGDKEEFYLHLANKHKIVDSLLACFVNNPGQELKPQQQLLKFIKPEVSIKQEPADQGNAAAVVTSQHSYLRPKTFQCLACHEDMIDAIKLAFHIQVSRHVNYSWALHSNYSAVEADGDNQQQPTSAKNPLSKVGLWFQKLDVSYRCSVCARKAGGLSINKFNSLADVFVHICEIHRDYFRTHYPATVTSFSLCPVCEGFIDLSSQNDDLEKESLEVQHYLRHGPVLLAALGILRTNKNLQDQGHYGADCTLCSRSFKSYEMFASHLEQSHISQVLAAFREFSHKRDGGFQDRCCICKERGETGVNHLAFHNKQILANMGLIRTLVKGHKSSRISCGMCNFVDKNCLKILQHFVSAHNVLFDYLIQQYDHQNPEATDIETRTPFNFDSFVAAVGSGGGVDQTKNAAPRQQSLLKTSISGEGKKFQYFCQTCKQVVGPDLVVYKKHLVDHCYDDMLEKVTEASKLTSKCPVCGQMEDTLELHYWINHSQGRNI